MPKQPLTQTTSLRPLAFLLVGMAFGYLLYHSLAGDTLLIANGYDSYALQAEQWLCGRTDIASGAQYPWLELAIYQDKYYLSFPAVPSVMLLPWVIAFGGAAAVPSNLVIALAALLTVAGVYLLFARAGANAKTCLFWAVISCLGSNFFWISTNGGVWFMAQVLNLCFVVWGLYFASANNTQSNTLAAILLAFAVGCRPFSILFLALLLAFIWLPKIAQSRNPLHWGAAFWCPFAAAAAIGGALAWYNYIRFGNFLEFGHNYLPEFVNAPDGQFGVGYFWGNFSGIFRPVTLNAALGLEFSVFNGFCLFIANPIFLLWGIALLQRIWHKTFCAQQGLYTLLCCLCVVLFCLHKTMGGWQFGVRYLVDCIPYIWLCTLPIWRHTQTQETPCPQTPADWQWFICALAVAFNVYGALYMLQA